VRDTPSSAEALDEPHLLLVCPGRKQSTERPSAFSVARLCAVSAEAVFHPQVSAER